MMTQPLTSLYLFLAVMLFVNVLGVVRPSMFPLPLRLLGSVSFIVVALFAPQIIMLGILLTAAVALHGGLSHGLGQLGLFLHLVSWGMLGWHFNQMRHIYPILDGKPVSDTDAPFPVKLDQPGGLPPAFRISFRPYMLQRTPAMRQIQIVRGIVYRQIGNHKLRLDVYRPKLPGPRPSVIYIHGGAWVFGTRRQSPFLLGELAAAGYVVFAIDYRLAPRHPMPAGLLDCKAAVAWVREHAASYGGTPDAVVMGGSAGGHLAAMIAVSDGQSQLQPGFEDKNTRVRGAVVLYGLADLVRLVGAESPVMVSWLLQRLVFKRRFSEDPDVFHQAQPLTYLTNKAPPILLVHGVNDSLVPIEEARSFREHLGRAGATRVHLCEIPLAVHAFEVTPSPLHQRAVRIILAFMDSLERPAVAVGDTVQP